MRVGGKSEEVRSRTAIEKGQWALCRVEIDGKTIRLWVDNEKVAEAKSGFRAADVYPAGVAKRNFVAAARGGKNPFHGAIEHFRIFHVVHPDFTNIPEVPMVSSRRISPDYPQRFAEKYADYPIKQMRATEKLQEDELHVFYTNFYAAVNERRAEMQRSDEGDRLEKEIEALKSEMSRKRNELTAAFNARPDIEAARARSNELNQRLNARRAEVRKEQYAEEMADIDQRARATGQRVNEIREAARVAMADHLAPLQEEIDKLTEDLNARRSELQENDPDAVSNRAERRAAEEELAKIDRQQDPEGHARWQATIRSLDDKHREISNELFREDASLRDMQRRIDQRRSVMRSMLESQARLIDPGFDAAARANHRWGPFNQERQAIQDIIDTIPDIAAIKEEMEGLNGFVGEGLRAFVGEGLEDIDSRIKAKEAQLRDAQRDAAVAMNWDEFNALPGGWTANQQLNAIRRSFMARELPFMTEYQRRFHAAVAAQRKWHTEVDWDDRLDWEKQPFEELTPTVQNWLRRIKPYLYQ